MKEQIAELKSIHRALNQTIEVYEKADNNPRLDASIRRSLFALADRMREAILYTPEIQQADEERKKLILQAYSGGLISSSCLPNGG
jgi:hypothetical protein